MRLLLTADPMIPVPPVGYGGIERIVHGLLEQYRDAGHETALIAHPASTAACTHRIAWPDLRVNGSLPGVRNALALRRAITEFRPDVVHSFSRLGYLLPVLPTRQPVVMSYQRHTGGNQLKWAARLGGRRLRFTGCSEFICQMGRRAGGDWTAIPNFVDSRRFSFVPRVPDDAPLVFLSRIEEIKGPHLAIAIARAAGRRLIIAGNRAETGAQRDYFDREIQPHLGQNGIEWIGEVDDIAKNKLLGSAAALLVPIQWDEPFGIVFVEALACGTPVITYPRGAAPEIVTPGRTGFLVNSIESGVAAVRTITTLDRTHCRDAVEREFSAAVAATRYLALYRTMLD